ncbi:uncharacterized protein CXQ87_002819 [Candidozyma duobushaemuli]|uniref:Uncharacterized protein n=2 Tax=Candidozyma TaxID=3303203 RepID=A0ABX8I1S4_9ASCO|nr:uncharacterized protein CXQ87_002819 [[Candida] duobushaemulonis]PVH14672.1 hypothetical protein CXQ87_002819 [[Candida] duobushaemulonis]QWU87181.1 hypothetical protein CA3LBN_001446 [[Candida] haemuloni]
MSSPSRSVIDPLIYSYPDSSGSSEKKKSNDSLPPASKLLSNAQSTAPPTTGWTPLVSKTLSGEMISHNSTPNTKVLPGFYRQATASGSAPSNDMDFPVLNLTPFLTHNLNFLNNQNSAGNPSSNVNFTPFYDKSMHLTDFFIDSPLRPSPSKAVETITPSRFAMSAERKSLSSTLDAATSTKRSIGQIDTPARHPFKKYDSQVDNDSETDNEDENQDDKPYEDNFVTPSKKNVLKETSGNLLNKTPLNQTPLASKKNKNAYHTPAKTTQMSSPSTVIMSSVNKSPDEDGSKARIVPPSPTPNKERVESTTAVNSEPVMGIFSERKQKPKAEASKPAAKKNTKKNQTGTSKFQIVFTDVHTLMNSKKKKEPETRSKKQQQERNQPKRTGSQRSSQRSQRPTRQDAHQHQFKQGSPPIQQHQHLQQQPPPTYAFQHTSSSLSASQDYNSTMNSSREFSMLGVNSSQNTTGANLNFSSTEHTSFELNNAGMASTPNRKYLLDNSFDKASPQAINQMTSSFHQVHVNHQDGMPPPKHLTLQHAAQQALRHPDQSHNPQMGMNMVMSTPQHSSINNNAFIAEESPSNREPMALLYQHLHQYEPVMQPGEGESGHK